MLLTDEDIPYEVGNDNIAYHSAYLEGAKAQLKKVVWELSRGFSFIQSLLVRLATFQL